MERPVCSVSVLVAARNEENNITELLQSFANQNYPQHLTEFIIIDDHSEDETFQRVTSFSRLNPNIRIHLKKNESVGKKAALSTGLKLAVGELVLVTDADCRPNEGWIKTMAASYQTHHSQLLLGPVRISSAKRFFIQMQELEFMSLNGSTAGAAGAQIPVMGNAANMGFNRLSAKNLNAFEETEIASGDDMFLLLAIRKKFGNKAIQFVYAPDAIVETKPQPDFKSFLQQRMRWAAKSRYYRDMFVIVPALIVMVFNLMLLFVLIAGLFSPIFILVFVLFVMLKFIIDYPLLYMITGFYNRRNLLWLALVWEFLYPLYVVFTTVSGFAFPYKWKDRRYRQ